MSNVGPVHKLIVRDVGDDDDFHTTEFEDYEIVHPDDEPEIPTDGIYRCAIDFNLDNVGLRFALQYTGTPVTEPGEYQIQAWAETIRGFDYTEYDGGIALVEAKGD